GMLVDAQLAVLLASEPPPPAWVRRDFRLALSGLVPLGPPLRSVRYCNHEVLRFHEMAPDPAIASPEPIAPGAEQYANLAESQANVHDPHNSSRSEREVALATWEFDAKQ